ncbi:MAG TPA: tripartite tricarboxylate transporter substrate binding protein [Methylomirabilota bacterium]|nr:tripartite tricarboxylate transporter substrate binding protein [Methylomirabilota bacterium]
MTRSLVTLLLAVLVMFPGSAASQEAFPSRPITIVNPFPPGGQADLSGRPLAAALEKVLKQPVVITNKPGASGAVGMQAVAVAKPDGYTISITVPAISMIPEVDKLFSRNPTFTREQFTPIARINADPCVVVVNAERPWKTMKDLLDDARKRPGEITFSSSGIYGASHVPMEMILQSAGGLKMRHLPTTGGGPATTAVLGGHADLWCSTTGPAAPHVKSGKFRALAVTSAARHPHFDAPTLKELGLDVEYYLWIGLFAPKATPAPVMKALREAVRQAVEDPAFKSALEKIQSPLAYQDADDFRRWWDADAGRLAEVIKRIGRIEAK